MGKLYERVNWEDKPSTKTPTSAANFNKMDKGIDDLDNKLVEQETKTESLASQVEQIASNQIPEEYLKASVDAYIDEKGAGLATNEDLVAIDTKIDEVNNQLSSEIANQSSALNNKISSEISRSTNEDNTLKQRAEVLEEQVNTLNEGGLNLKEDFIGQQINEWLDEHPEATTTVQDGAITIPKFSKVLADRETLYDVYLTDYGDIDDDNIVDTIGNAIADLNGKRLIFPHVSVNLGKITIEGKSNFELVGNSIVDITAFIYIYNCSNFKISNFSIVSTEDKPSNLYIQRSNNFVVANNSLCGGYNSEGVSTLENLHVSTHCYDFKIIGNKVCDTRLDGILVHDYSYNFIVANNIVQRAGYTGIECEGRSNSSLTDPQINRVRQGIVANNIVEDCKDWGILLLWCANVDVTGNVTKNNKGALLSVGGSVVNICNNILEGNERGLELSPEYFSMAVSTVATNSYVKVTNNVIVANPRYDTYRTNNGGIVDICRANICEVANNTIIFKGNAENIGVNAYINVSLSKNISILNNRTDSQVGNQKMRWGICLCQTNRDSQTGTVYDDGVSNIEICGNHLDRALYLLGFSEIDATSESKIKNIKDIFVKDNHFYNSRQDVETNCIGLLMNRSDVDCSVFIGKNYFHNLITANYNFAENKSRMVIYEQSIIEGGDLLTYSPTNNGAYQNGDVVCQIPTVGDYLKKIYVDNVWRGIELIS